MTIETLNLKHLKKTLALSLTLSLVFFPSLSLAQDLDLEKIAQWSELANQQNLHTQRLLAPPPKIRRTDDSQRVAQKTLQHGLENWVEASSLEDLAWVQQIKSLDQLVDQTLFSTPSDSEQTPTESESTQSKEPEALRASENPADIRFQLRTLEAQASIIYKNDFLNANVTYRAAQQRLQIELSHQLSQGADLVVSHLEDASGRNDQLSLRYSW